MGRYLLFDVGGTFIKYALSDENGTFLEQGKVPTPVEDREEFFEALFSVAEQFAHNYEACCISMPGCIDTDKGISITAGALSRILRDFPVGATVSERLGVPVTVGNDGKCAAQAEAWKGALSDCANGLVVVMGTATGGGVIIDHKVYLGSTYSAGELSYFLYDGPMVKDGFTPMKGVEAGIPGNNPPAPYLMAYASAPGYIVAYKQRKGLGADEDVSGEEFFAKVREGEAEAVETLEEVSDKIAVNILSLQSVLDVEKVAFGGGVSGAPELLPAIRASVHKYFADHVKVFPLHEPEIVRCQFGADANLLGALKLHFDKAGRQEGK